MKVEYELYLQTWSHLNSNAKEDEDYETVDYEPCVNYSDAVRSAKKLSKKVPYKDYHGRVIQRVQIAAYYSGDEAEYEFGTSYHLLWLETYSEGKCMGRFNFNF